LILEAHGDFAALRTDDQVARPAFGPEHVLVRAAQLELLFLLAVPGVQQEGGVTQSENAVLPGIEAHDLNPRPGDQLEHRFRHRLEAFAGAEDKRAVWHASDFLGDVRLQVSLRRGKTNILAVGTDADGPAAAGRY